LVKRNKRAVKQGVRRMKGLIMKENSRE